MSIKPPKIKTVVLLGLLAFICVVGIRVMSHQDNSKNTIRILIDRFPQSQSLDINAQKIKPLWDELHYQLEELPDREIVRLTKPGRPTLEFRVVRDEITRALLFLRGDADVLYNNLSIAKTEWVRKQNTQVQVFEKESATLSYLGFQTKNQFLKDPRVRLAIASALPIDEWIKYKFLNWLTRNQEVQPPAHQIDRANKILEDAGYGLKNGARFSLRYFTTPVREGNEIAQLVKEALSKIGIRVEITTFDTSLYFNRIGNGDFDLISTRWLRRNTEVDASEVLGPNQPRNYIRYESATLIDTFQKNPHATLKDLAPLIEQEWPLVPLFNWKLGLVAGPRLMVPADIESSLDETYRFLARIDLRDTLE